MKMNKRYQSRGLLCGALLLLTAAQPLQAQEERPANPSADQVEEGVTAPADTLRTLTPVKVGNSMPKGFLQTRPNVILRQEALFPFFEHLTEGREPVRIVHIGDSHIRGHVLTVATRQALEKVFGSQAVYPDTITYHTSAKARETGEAGLVYHALGINGAITRHFTTEERLQEVADLQPDLIILSFGTNESHSKNYDVDEHLQQMDSLVTLLGQACPKAQFLLTTPPGSYLTVNRSQKVINRRTPQVVETILAFAEERNLPVWDLYDIAGGKNRACLNWKNNLLMKRDQVHFTNEGYRVQGNLLAEALLKAYNSYVGH
jgi:lysophospholipase L1-like esterase